jgi:hypothetical protein
MLDRIASARNVAFGSYFLRPGPVRDALERAAERGAHVSVTLQADPYKNDYGAKANADAARVLRDAGAKVTLFDSARVPFHLKAAVADGVAFLDDRNWTRRGPELVLADDAPSDVAIVRDALRGRGGANDVLATRKDAALARELRLVQAAGRAPLTVETEYVAPSPMTTALAARAQLGEPTTLVVSAKSPASTRERRTIARLRAAGVDVRRGGVNEKLALAGDTAWIGSCSATGAWGRTARQLEWGLLTRDPAMVSAVRAALSRDAPRAACHAAACAAPA